jgi:hypothetical protein
MMAVLTVAVVAVLVVVRVIVAHGDHQRDTHRGGRRSAVAPTGSPSVRAWTA